jgi:cell wall-associated NlpC family hydrolase
MIALFLLLGLLLVRKGLLFAEESTAAPQTVRYKLVKMARTFLGLPYRWGGMSERQGVDCSGLVKMLFAKLHIELPRSSREQIRSGEGVPMDKVEMGDLVFFSDRGKIPTHVGVYVGNNQFLHAEKRAGHVIITDLNQPWYAKRLLGARRVMDLGKSERVQKGAEEEFDVISN